MNDDRKITLGGEVYEVKPINLGMLKAIGIGSAKTQSVPITDPVNREGVWYDGTFEVLAAGLGLTVDQVTKIENVTLQELISAQRKVYEITGLIVEDKTKAPAPGEGQGASTG